MSSRGAAEFVARARRLATGRRALVHLGPHLVGRLLLLGREQGMHLRAVIFHDRTGFGAAVGRREILVVAQGAEFGALLLPELVELGLLVGGEMEFLGQMGAQLFAKVARLRWRWSRRTRRRVNCGDEQPGEQREAAEAEQNLDFCFHDFDWD